MKKILVCTVLLRVLTASGQDTTVQQSNPLTISGYVEGYYLYDFSKPSNHSEPGFIYSHNRHNEFNINLAFLKARYAAQRVRANIALAAGTYMNANYAAEPGVLKNVFEANAGYKLTRNKNIWFDIGIMPSHIGFESAISKDCWTVTRSILADNSPYFESGAKLTYASDNSKWLFSALALNGWQRITRVEQNSLMSWGTQIQFKPGEGIIFNYSTFFGTDKPDSARLWRYFHNLYATLQLSDKIGLIAGFDIGQEQKFKNSNEKNTWYSPVAIIQFKHNEKWASAIRGEYYSDENEVIVSTGTPNGFKTAGFSANVDYLPLQNIAMRLEVKTLNSKDKIFNKDGNNTDSNSMIIFSTAISL